jgi:hypothetical protein
MSDPTDGSASGIATLDEIVDLPQSGIKGKASIEASPDRRRRHGPA